MNQLSLKTRREILGASIGIVLAGAYGLTFIGTEAFFRSPRDAAALGAIGAIIGGSLLRDEVSRMAYWAVAGGILALMLFGNVFDYKAGAGIALGAVFGLLHQILHDIRGGNPVFLPQRPESNQSVDEEGVGPTPGNAR